MMEVIPAWTKPFYDTCHFAGATRFALPASSSFDERG
jgi:hypothetical protein